jgi:hypothetical protein
MLPAFALDEIRIDRSTREARLKWVMVVDRDLNPGLIANAVGCLAAAVGNAVPTLLGPGGADAAGHWHPGLPWTGCSVLAADRDKIASVRARALGKVGVHVVDMPEPAQTSRVYQEYLDTLAAAGEVSYHAVSLVGPRNVVDKLVGGLRLLA